MSGNKQPKHIDYFRLISEDEALYSAPLEFASKFERYSALLSASSLTEQQRIDIQLALLRIRRIRLEVGASEALGRLRQLETMLSDPLSAVKLNLVRGEVRLFRTGEYVAALELLSPLEGRLKNSPDQFLYALLAGDLAVAYMMTGNLRKAEEYCQDCLSIWRRQESRFHYAHGLHNYGILKKKAGQYREAEVMIRSALKAFGSREIYSAPAWHNLGTVKLKVGDWNNAGICFSKAQVLASRGSGNPALKLHLGSAQTSMIHLRVLRRSFDKALESSTLFSDTSGKSGRRNLVLLHEFIAELHLEKGELDDAQIRLDQAREIALKIAPESDLMTEIRRRQAQLFLQRQDFDSARAEVRQCIRLCRKIGDKHELGAALRILGQVYVAKGFDRKASSAFEAGINTLKAIGECYELMRTCIEYSELLVTNGAREAEIYLLDAEQLCKRLELDFFMTRILLLQSKFESGQKDYDAAHRYLTEAEALCDTLQTCDQKQLVPKIRKFAKALQETILEESVDASERLKSLGRIYEDTRFPIEELKPELATTVARNVGAEALFVAEKANRGYRIPIKYNTSVNEAKTMLSRKLRGDARDLFRGTDPKVRNLSSGEVLVAVPLAENRTVCMVMAEGKNVTPRELEFLFASAGALGRLAEETRVLKAKAGVIEDEGPLRHPGGYFKGILTLDPEMIRIIHMAERGAEGNLPVLIEGETGVGKELFAKAIHRSSRRREREFVVINAGGMPVNLLESQLFGHVKGAFTDAVVDRVGLIEEAQGGTLFLDEVGEMGEELQVKLLRLLENGEYRRLGDNRVRTADVRVISATNKKLETQIERGLFREDLYYRLAMLKIRIPPLRERKRDIEFLIRHFLNDGMRQIGLPPRAISVDTGALEAIEHYRWPGNVRELRNEILKAIALIGEGEVIRFNMLSERIARAFESRNDSDVLTKRVERFERRLILKALEDNDWNRVKAAAQIGIPRTTLMFKMKRLDIVS